MSTMKELAAAGWKSDNGFRAVYLTRAKEALRREFPKTDLCVHPHIKSKISSWKRNYYSLMHILDHSGVGFNANGNYKIDIDDEQWAQVLQVAFNILLGVMHFFVSVSSLMIFLYLYGRKTSMQNI